MAHECYHCKRWIEDGEAHDCWTTTETALTQDLAEDLRDAYERLRETAIAFGGAVVSKPIAKKTTFLFGFAAARFTASSGE